MVTPTRQRLLGFCRHLRREGFRLGVAETVDALAAVGEHLLDERAVRFALRALSCGDHDEWQRFDDLFDRYWYPWRVPAELDAAATIDPRLRRRAPGIVGFGTSTTEASIGVDGSGMTGAGAGRHTTIARADYRFLSDKRAMRQAERLAERLAMLLRSRCTRRRLMRNRGSRIDIRRTVRCNMGVGGVPVERVYTERRREPVHLIVLHDISHSMAGHNPLLYRFVRGLVRTFRTSEAFAFHTRLFRVTEIYRERSLDVMRGKLEASNHLWLGGTCIARSLQAFIDEWMRSVLAHRSVVLLLSDGFDTDSPADLAEALRLLKARAHKVVWLNPMLGRDGYRADEPTLRAAKPHVDLLAPAHSVHSLEQAVEFIADAARGYRSPLRDRGDNTGVVPVSCIGCRPFSVSRCRVVSYDR